jgi:D-xylose transport system substrate-binding protein
MENEMFRRVIRFCIIVALGISLVMMQVGCKPSSLTGETTPGNTKTGPLIGFAMDTLVIERWESDRNIFVSTVGELGGEVIIQNANSDSDEQKNQIRYLIKKKVDVLVIVAIDESKLGDEIQLAEEHGIDVIAYDRMIHRPGVDLCVSFDNTAVGRLMAEAMIRVKPEGQFVIMKGSEADRNSALVREGIQSVLVEHPSCSVIAEEAASNWSADDAFAKFKSILSSHTDIDGIFCGNDALAGAAVRALALYRMSGQVLVTGQDADLDACQRIVEGTQLMTVYKPIGTLAKAAATAAIALAQGEKPAANDKILVEGVEIPFDRISPIAVDRTNLDEVIIKSGFHNLKDVYRNIPESQWPAHQD